jgi:SAM-dependent methyltransferase
MPDKIETIGGVTLNYDFFDAGDSYSEGDEAEEFILDVLKNERDIYDVLSSDSRFPVLYQLSPRRKYIADPMDIDNNDDVLEIGSGMGAVTEGIAGKAKFVDCVDLSKRRSIANAYRNKRRNNISIYVGNFENIRFARQYDVIVMVGVLEYAQIYIKSETPFEDLLKKIRVLLKPGGKAYIAIENRFGMRYFSGCVEDHWGKAFVGIEGYPGGTCGNKAKTFSRLELERLLSAAGFGKGYFFYPHPDYKMPTVIYSDDWLPKAADIIDRSTFYGAENPRLFDDGKALESLAGTDLFKIFANSFLVEVVKT